MMKRRQKQQPAQEAGPNPSLIVPLASEGPSLTKKKPRPGPAPLHPQTAGEADLAKRAFAAQKVLRAALVAQGLKTGNVDVVVGLALGAKGYTLLVFNQDGPGTVPKECDGFPVERRPTPKAQPARTRRPGSSRWD